MSRRRSPTLILFLAGAALAAGCRSTPAKYRSASERIADDLVEQLEKRVDPRHARVLVYEFETAAPGRGADSRFVRNSPGLSERELGWQVKHQLTSALAQNVIVLEVNRRDLAMARGVDSTAEVNPYRQAIDLGANVVLVGNFSVVDGEDILLMARMIDAETQQVLATAEAIVSDVEIPSRSGW